MGAVMLYLMATVFSVTIVTAQVSDGCKKPLGMKNGGIQDSQLTSSGFFGNNPNFDATEARLDGQSCWAAREANSEQWIQVDFNTTKYVAGIVLQSSPYTRPYETWVTAYQIQYGIGESSWQYVQCENQDDMVCQGNSDRNSHVTSLFTSEVWVTRIRIRPTRWNRHISLRFEILGCEVSEACIDQLGMKDGTILDRRITASSEYNANHGPNNARLDRPAGSGRKGAWSASSNDNNQWIQVDFGTLRSVSGIVLQGRSDAEQWVTKYKVQYSNDGSTWQYIQDNNNVDRVFNGNSDRDGHVTSRFVSTISAGYIRIRPTEWHRHISMRFELLGCDVSEACVEQLGMKDGTIPDRQITASSEYGANYGPNNARLDRPAGSGRTGAWSALSNDVNQWIQVDFVTLRSVSGIVLQGRSDYDQWVTKYKVQYSNDGSTWQYIQYNNNVDRVFNGNSDRDEHVTSIFVPAISAAYIRIHPTEWYGHITLRFELLGCDDINECDSNPCINGACQDGTNLYTCICAAGWTGYNCDQDINECDRNPCMNGQCQDGINQYTCVCDASWSGTDCDENINECDSNPCMNGQCQDGIYQYICICDAGWTGVNCDQAAVTRASVVTTIATSSESMTNEFSSTAVGASIGSIVLLLIMGGVIVLVVMKRRRRQQHPESNKSQTVVQLDGPYGDTVTNIITSPPTKDSHMYAGVTGANGDAVATPPIDELYQDVSDKSSEVHQGTDETYQDITEEAKRNTSAHDDDIYQDVQDNEYAYAHVDAVRDKIPSVDGNLVQIDAKSQYGGVPRSADNRNQQEGWVDNDIYAKSDEDQQPKRQTGDDNRAEVWVENDIYATSDEDQLKRQGEENDKEEGWMDNSIYATTDE